MQILPTSWFNFFGPSFFRSPSEKRERPRLDMKDLASKSEQELADEADKLRQKLLASMRKKKQESSRNTEEERSMWLGG